jgi:hypothetical protein
VRGEIGASRRSDGGTQIAEEVAEEEIAARVRLVDGAAGYTSIAMAVSSKNWTLA